MIEEGSGEEGWIRRKSAGVLYLSAGEAVVYLQMGN